MKVTGLALLTFAFIAVTAVRPPTPLCRVSPLPSQIPVTVGQQLRFDLQDIFSGYNLMLNGTKNDHIKVSEKYEVIQSAYPTSYNFSNVKIKASNRFLGLIVRGDYSGLVIGTNDDTKGVTVDFEVSVQNIPNLHCFDVDEVIFGRNSMVVVDCAVFSMGEVVYNQFLYVNLTDKKVIQGSHLTDTFVNYNFISKRRIEVISDPFTRVSYLLRFNLREGVSAEHQDQTYAQVFLMTNPLKPQLLDVIDHTFLELPKLSIADYQVSYNLIYLLAYNKALYEIRLTPDQAIVIRSKFNIKLDISRFRVDRLGFNDDLNVVATNGNTIYQFQWDVTSPPTLINKYTLIPGTKVEQIFVDYNFVVVSGISQWDNEVVRRTWIFTKRANTYLNAYNVFYAPSTGPHLIVWNQHGSTLHIFNDYFAYYIKMSLPYLTLKTVDVTKVNSTEVYEVTAISRGDNGTNLTCVQKINFLFLGPGDTRILKTGFWPRNQINVDADDQREFPLTYEFFGANLTYNVTFASSTNSSITPYYYVNKQHKAIFNWPPQINPANIVYYQMFTQIVKGELKPQAIYGLVQEGVATEAKTIYTTHYVRCRINVFNRDDMHLLNCQIIMTTRFAMGRIIVASQMFQPQERRIAIIFDETPHTVYIYYFWPEGFGFFGRKDYAGDAGNRVTGVTLTQRKLFVVLEYGKRVDMFNIDDLQQATDVIRAVAPRFVLNSNVMRFFGVSYFAPVDIKISRFHKEVVFLKTKSGVMALNINEDFLPQLLFTVPTDNIRYDFEISQNNLLILTESSTTFYDLQIPLRRSDPPLKKQTLDTKFKIGEYDEVCSDRLFYMVGFQSTFVVNPNLRSASKLYAEIWVKQPILNIDAVNILDMEILFIHTKSQITAYVFAENPKLTVAWPPRTQDFSMNLTAYNPATVSEPYSLQVNIIDINETEITPTEEFDKQVVRKLGKVKSPKDNTTFSTDISINQSTWFNGTVLKYQVATQDPECQGSATIKNHVEVTRKVIEARAIYDIESTADGIYAQQYSSLLKSHTYNDSINYISKVPTQRRGEVCSKLAVGQFQQYVVSLCQVGDHVNVYITTTIASKPFTFGPYQTDAREVNHAKIVGQILMIVDNSDDPLTRPGGIYLYNLNFDIEDPDFISLLDYIDDQDLQIEGFDGVPFIGSADIHTPFYDVDNEYRLFLTEASTGSIFVFGFQISEDGEQIIYLSKKYIPLSEMLPHELRYPTPLRILTINIHYAFDNGKGKNVDYYLLLSVSNWHHMQLMITLSHNDDIVAFKLERLFERFPWGQLQNYFKYKRGRAYQTYFAVPYVNNQERSQLILIYSVPYIINAEANTYQEKYSAHSYRELRYGLDLRVPIIGALGAHQVDDIFQTAFAFQTFGNDKLLWSDMHGNDINQITLNINITVFIRNLSKENETIHVTASNVYSNFTFDIDLSFFKDKDDDDIKEKKSILWIVVIGIAAVMIVGLLIAFVKQRKSHREIVEVQNRQTLLTVDDIYKNDNLEINRSSVDIGSIRESIEPTMPVAVRQPQAAQVAQAESSSSDKAEQEGQNLSH